MAHPQPPFTCSFSPNVPELLDDLNCSIAISTYQAGKVVFVSASSRDNLIQLPRTFEKPMGIAVNGNKLAIASKHEVTVYGNSTSHAKDYPENPNVYDHLYIPRASYYCGATDVHDLTWSKWGLIAVNTLFCCIARIDDEFSFKPLWKPAFITDIVPEDRCHLNGITLLDDVPKYATALGEYNTAQGWRASKKDGGIIIDIPTNEIIARNLPMPHSPRIYDNQLYTLFSATGELAKIDVNTGKYEVINQFNGFVRGMARMGDYLFVGLSKLREKSVAFGDLPIAKKSLFSGIVIVYLPKGSIVGHIRYETSVEEIYDVQVLPGMKRPGLLSLAKDTHRRALVTPETGFWGMDTSKKES